MPDSSNQQPGRPGIPDDATRLASPLSVDSEDPPVYFAPCPRGLQDFLAREVSDCGGQSIETRATGVQFCGPLTVAYQLNLVSRIASRVMLRVATKRYRTDRDLYKIAERVTWESHFGPDQTLRVDIRAVRSNLRSLKIAALRVKDAIVDRMRAQFGNRPNIDTNAPDVRVAIFLEDRQASLYIDLSGDNLFKRGWRSGDDKGSAPIKENLAAGVLAACGWDRTAPFYDPFCGSGTIAIEAAQLRLAIAPQRRQTFGLQRLKSFDPSAWQVAQRQVAKARTEITQDHNLDSKSLIFASDVDRNMISIAHANAVRSGLPGGSIQLRTANFLDCKPPVSEPGWLISNLPYGERMDFVGKGDVLRSMGSHLRQHYSGWTACLLSSDHKLPGKLGLRERRKIPLYNGTLDCRLFLFDIR